MWENEDASNFWLEPFLWRLTLQPGHLPIHNGNGREISEKSRQISFHIIDGLDQVCASAFWAISILLFKLRLVDLSS